MEGIKQLLKLSWNPFEHRFKRKVRRSIEVRIQDLKEADLKACRNRWDSSKSSMERAAWREQSNELTARRHELEHLLKQIQ